MNTSTTAPTVRDTTGRNRRAASGDVPNPDVSPSRTAFVIGSRTLGEYAAKAATPYDVFRDYIDCVIASCGGSLSAAARKMRMHRRTLQRMRNDKAVRTRVTGAEYVAE